MVEDERKSRSKKIIRTAFLGQSFKTTFCSCCKHQVTELRNAITYVNSCSFQGSPTSTETNGC